MLSPPRLLNFGNYNFVVIEELYDESGFRNSGRQRTRSSAVRKDEASLPLL